MAITISFINGIYYVTCNDKVIWQGTYLEGAIETARKEFEYINPPKIKDTGRYQSGYRVFRDGSYREDFGSDR